MIYFMTPQPRQNPDIVYVPANMPLEMVMPFLEACYQVPVLLTTPVTNTWWYRNNLAIPSEYCIHNAIELEDFFFWYSGPIDVPNDQGGVRSYGREFDGSCWKTDDQVWDACPPEIRDLLALAWDTQESRTETLYQYFRQELAIRKAGGVALEAPPRFNREPIL